MFTIFNVYKREGRQMKNFNDVKGIYTERENSDVKNGIVLTKYNNHSKKWVSVFRLGGVVKCREADTKELAVYNSYKAAVGK